MYVDPCNDSGEVVRHHVREFEFHKLPTYLKAPIHPDEYEAEVDKHFVVMDESLEGVLYKEKLQRIEYLEMMCKVGRDIQEKTFKGKVAFNKLPWYSRMWKAFKHELY